MREADVLIVGGGPAGASCARELVKAGKRVIVLDKASFPRDKLCAGWVPPGLFSRIGIKPEEYPHGLRTYRVLHFRIKGFPLPLPTRQYAIRRVEFDHWLLERSGAEVHRHRVRHIEMSGGESVAAGETVSGGESVIDGESVAAGETVAGSESVAAGSPKGGSSRFVVDGAYSAPYLVGAGGTGCPVARHAGHTRTADSGSLIVTMEEEFYYPKRKEACYLRFFDTGLVGYSWYFPKADGYLTVGIGGKQAELRRRGETIRDHWTAFARRLWQNGLVRNHDFAPSGHSYYLRSGELQRGYEHLYLVGDAAGLATVDMGEGIEPAVHSGYLAARAIVENTPYSAEPIKRRSLPEIMFSF